MKKNGSITCDENGIAEVYDENVIKELKEMEVFINYPIYSIDEQIGSDEDGLKIVDTISTKEDIENEFVKNDLNRMLWEQVENLDDPRKTLIINRLYKDDKRQLQVAEELWVSGARVQ